jgi:WD40 repeat protein
VWTSEQELCRGQIEDLETYLGLSENLESDLTTAEDARMPGTCEWFSRKDAFQNWRNFDESTPTVLWVCGKPAAGKSILAGYATKYLRNENPNCSSFFFKHGDDSKSRLGACLRSLAYQMACGNFSIREKLLEMQRDGVKFDKDNERTVWRKLFISGVFQTKFPCHYWVIDALDECVNSEALFSLVLDGLDTSIPLRVLVTSRMTAGLERSFKSLSSHRYQLLQISSADTLPDIKLLVEAKAKIFRVKADDDRTNLVEKIIQKSNGSFLWTILVIKELSNAHSQKKIDQVLGDVPPGMKPLYQRTLDLMLQNTLENKLAKAILVWAACATRPVSLAELDSALKHDVNETFVCLEETVLALCGQLVTVDKFGRVQMVHETAREFLMDSNFGSEFAINPTQAHTRIAKACLLYLTGEEMKPIRSGRRQSPIAVKRADFSLYACTTFSYHLANADPKSNDLLLLLDKFLKCNVLSWIEVIAQREDLLPLIRVAKNFRTYLTGCSAERSPLSREISLIRGWTMDLVRITAKFADALVLSPSAIYSLVLPFCPTASSVFKTANNGRRLSIVGLSNSQWDDRMICIDFYQGQTSAICAGDDYLVVGLTNGLIRLYHAASYQEYRTLNHGETVKFLQFKPKSDLMASCGMKNIRIWDIRRGEIVHSFQAPQRPISLVFDKNLILAASHQNSLATWDLDNDGARKPDRLWNDSFDQIETRLRQSPCAIAISVSHQMLAVVYNGKPILLWDLAGDAFYGNCGRKLSNGETSTHVVSALVFNPNVDIGLLAASYLDGQLALLDPFNDQEHASYRANCHTLVSSHDGRLLAGAAGSGIIQVYEFDTLRLLYRVKSSNFYIKQLAFTPNGLHFADIRGSQCNVWEPAILLRDMVGDDSSIDSSSSVVEVISSDSKIRISTTVLHPNAEVAFCGKEDGSVSVYNLKTGAQVETLYSHKTLVRVLAWCPLMDVIISVDASNGIFAWKLKQNPQRGSAIERQLFQSRLDCGKSIIQVLPGEVAGKFILSTRESDHFWSMDGHEEQIREHLQIPMVRKWIQHPESPFHLICIDGEWAKIYAWADWSEVACVPLGLGMDGLQLKCVLQFTMNRNQRVLIELSDLDGSASTRRIAFVDTHLLDIERESKNDRNGQLVDVQEVENTSTECLADTILSPCLRSQIDVLADHVSHIIGISDSGRLVFLDSHSWVCSAGLEGNYSSSFSYSRHFFVPYDWFSGTRDIICALSRRDVIFARNDNLAIVKGGLEFVETVDVPIEFAILNGGRRRGLENKLA